MSRGLRLAMFLAWAVAAGANAEAPGDAPRPLPRPDIYGVTAVLPAKSAPLRSFRPLPRPRPVSVSAAPRTPDPITAILQALVGEGPRSPRPEARPNGLETLLPAVVAPRATSTRGSVCGVAEIKGEALAPIDGAGACGIAAPVRVTSVSGVPLSMAPTIDCTTAKALNSWVREGVIPAIGRTGGGLAKINVIAHYACRSRNNQAGAKLSEHAKGHAVDVAGVTLRDGTSLTVLNHWRSARYGKVIKAMHSSACGVFGTVLGPNADRYHQNHLHVDTARYRGGAYCR